MVKATNKTSNGLIWCFSLSKATVKHNNVKNLPTLDRKCKKSTLLSLAHYLTEALIIK